MLIRILSVLALVGTLAACPADDEQGNTGSDIQTDADNGDGQGSSRCEVDDDCVGEVTPGTCERAVCTAGTCGVLADPSTAGTACDDGNLCTTEDACNAQGLCNGATIDCDDGYECTVDSCDPETGTCSSYDGACDPVIGARQVIMTVAGESTGDGGELKVRSIGTAHSTPGVSTGGDITVTPAKVQLLPQDAP